MAHREIKVRAWDTRKKIMHSPYTMGRDQLTLSPDGRGFINVSGVSVKLSTYCTHLIPLQYIGVKDMKRTEAFPDGQEICEADIVRASIYSNEEPQILEVKFVGSAFIIEYEDSESDTVLLSEFVGSVEILGNIYEHPELI